MMERYGKWEPPSEADIAKAGDIELQKILRITSRSMEDLIMQMKDNLSQTDESIENSLHELSGYDKELKRMRGQLKVVVAKKLDLEEGIEKEKEKLAEIENHPDYTDVQCEEIRAK